MFDNLIMDINDVFKSCLLANFLNSSRIAQAMAASNEGKAIRNIGRIISILKKREISAYLDASKTENPFRVLIATVLSQRTRDENTEIAAANLFRHYNTAKKLATADRKRIEKLIKKSGFYKTKARRIIEISRALLDSYHGKVPDSKEELMKLKGVGPKTANCVLVYGFGKRAIPVDVHVHRISNRLGLVKTKTPEESEKELEKILPKRYWLAYNALLVSFGQQLCKPIKPECWRCPIIRYCGYIKKYL